MKPLAKHIVVLGGILLLVGLVYSRIPDAYFCAYDDFLEVHRAAFEDTQEPRHVFTTTHFQSYKYRPLNRGLNLVTYWVGGGNASYFRARNVFFHLVNVVLVYILGWLIFRRVLTSAAAAVLFGLHPLANQAVVGAVMTNTVAHALFLFALVCFLISFRKKRGRFIWLGIALISGWISVFTYEAAIVIFPMMGSYILIHHLLSNAKLADRRYVIVLTLSSLVLVGAYFAIRSHYVPYASDKAVPGVKAMVKNAAMYAGAMALPVDSFLANQWFGTPLPPEIEVKSSKTLWVLILLGIVGVVAIGWFLLKPLGRRLLDAARPDHLFLIVAIVASLSVLLIFTDKPSETYMYLPIAFATILFSSLVEIVIVAGRARNGRTVYLSVVGVLCISFGCATWVRNGRVANCGATAERITSSLRQSKLKNGVWFIWLAPAPGEAESHRYGMYGWRGIDTVGRSAIEPAAQWINGNKSLAAKVVTPQYLQQNCIGSRAVCFWVHDEGNVAEVGQKLSAK